MVRENYYCTVLRTKSADIMLKLKESGIDYTLYFIIQIFILRKSIFYEKKKTSVMQKLGVPFIDEDETYDQDREDWFEQFHDQPERGKRCTGCFEERFERTARYALQHQFDMISRKSWYFRWKDMDQINCVAGCCRKFCNVRVLDINTKRWIKKNDYLI